MLTEMPASELRLNELARRVGLAKSNVLRYFESREAILLELLDRSWQDWNRGLSDVLPQPAADLEGRCARLTQVYIDSLVLRPVLCDLLAAQAGVLEHNVSVDVATRFKERAIENSQHLGKLVMEQVPEIGRSGTAKFCVAALVSTGAAWTHSQAAPAMLEMYDLHPELAESRIDFARDLHEMLDLVLAGILAGKS